jgi:putative FmdB family regulatory protein
MATYQYRCDEHGLVETTRPIGTAPPELSCTACGRPAQRAYSSPRLALADRRAVALLDRTERTRESPDVVTALPQRALSRVTPQGRASPAQRRLPRP